MAHVEFPKGIQGVSGTLSSRKYKDIDGNIVTRKVIVTCSKTTGKQRIYLREYKGRSTMPSPKELAIRERFAQAAAFYSALTDADKERYYRLWRKDNLKYNGKKYATLRGYVVARFYANDTLTNKD